MSALRRLWWLGLLLLAALPLLWARWPASTVSASTGSARTLSPERLVERWQPERDSSVRIVSVHAGDAHRSAEIVFQREGVVFVQRLDAFNGESLGAAEPEVRASSLSREATAAFSGLAWLLLAAPWVWRRRALRRGVSATRSESSDAPWWVAHASQSGQAQMLAERTVAHLRALGRDARLLSIAQLDVAGLIAARRLLLVVSTTGEGDPPDTAAAFVRRVMSQTPDLSVLRFGLLALGDRSYSDYCAFGRVLDGWLQEHGAKPLFGRIEVDDGDPQAIADWLHALEDVALASKSSVTIDHAGKAHTPDRVDSVSPVPVVGVVGLHATPAPTVAENSIPKQWRGWVLHARHCLNPDSAAPALCDLELHPAEGVLPPWLPGDVAVLRPHNSKQAILRWLDQHGIKADAQVWIDGQQRPVQDALRERVLNGAAAPSLVPSRRAVAGRQGHALSLVDPDPVGRIARLPVLPVREYSIASTTAGGRLRLIVRMQNDEEGRPGLGSGTLLDSPLGTRLEFRLRSNPGFRPPAPDVPLILIGAGSGLAGLLGLLEARAGQGVAGNWLLFGERDPQRDRVLDAELQAYVRSGLLQHLDRSFSRDASAPAYVQHALHSHALRLREWLARGAHLRVCGSRSGMGEGVHATLIELLGEDAVDALVAEGRYRREVF